MHEKYSKLQVFQNAVLFRLDKAAPWYHHVVFDNVKMELHPSTKIHSPGLTS